MQPVNGLYVGKINVRFKSFGQTEMHTFPN